jgi:polyisoprenoid-binding protein YceI
MKSKYVFLSLAAALCTTSLHGKVLEYAVDPVHSGITFKIRHFINRVPGNFNDFQGKIHFDPASPEKSLAIAKIEARSIHTRNDDRDAHLQGDDFFKTGEHPLVEFTSTKWTSTGENTYKVEGLLKMVGVERPITLDVTYMGEVEGRGVYRSGWEGTTTIDRTDWGISYGLPAIGKEVQIEINIQAHRPME